MPISLHKVLAGVYWSDAGALLGVLPYSIWSKNVATDERHRLNMALNLLLIQTDTRNILVDTGLGNRITDKIRRIYNPSAFQLPVSLSELGLKDTDITDVVMTHLHFDHAGGIVTGFGSIDALTFPKAIYHIQKEEWEIAKTPDGLNRAAYSYEEQLSLLDNTGKIELIEGDFDMGEGVFLKKVGGHSLGSQIIEIDSPDGFHIYAGDIIATKFHLMPHVCSSYDINRQQTYETKLYIYNKLRERKGFLLLDHDLEDWVLPISSIPFS